MTTLVTIKNTGPYLVAVTAHDASIQKYPNDDPNPLSKTVILRDGEEAAWTIWSSSHLLVQEIKA